MSENSLSFQGKERTRNGFFDFTVFVIEIEHETVLCKVNHRFGKIGGDVAITKT